LLTSHFPSPVYRPADADIEKLAAMIQNARTVAIFGGDGCRDAREEVLALAAKLKAPVGYSFRGKQWLEHDNLYATGMTGLLGYGGAYSIEQEEAGFVPFGVAFKNPNFARVAAALGAKGIRLEEPGDVHDALSEALAYKKGPVVLDAVVDPFALSLPSHVPFHTAKGYTLSLAKQVLAGKMDDVIKTIERNVRLV
jgi:thiamine pyrophosphate-dependent acetolactate synthase large subunit-like protein